MSHSPKKNPSFVLTVTPLPSGQKRERQRVDAFLREQLPGVSLREARDLVAEGLVTRKGKVLRAGDSVGVGQEIFVGVAPGVFLPGAERVASVGGWKQAKPTVLFQDEALVVLEKPSGMHSVLHRWYDEPTVADFIVTDILSESELSAFKVGDSEKDAGLLQRLDFETSGIITAALTSEAWHALRVAQAEGQVEKKYLAIVEGVFPDTELRSRVFITADRGSPTVEVTPDRGEGNQGLVRAEAIEGVIRRVELPVIDELRVLLDEAYGVPNLTESEGGGWSVVEVTTSQGVRHQVRAHLASLGYPLVWDTAYGARSVEIEDEGLVQGLDDDDDGDDDDDDYGASEGKDSATEQDTEADAPDDSDTNAATPLFLLHASHLSFPHPSRPDGERVMFTSFPSWSIG